MTFKPSALTIQLEPNEGMWQVSDSACNDFELYYVETLIKRRVSLHQYERRDIIVRKLLAGETNQRVSEMRANAIDIAFRETLDPNEHKAVCITTNSLVIVKSILKLAAYLRIADILPVGSASDVRPKE